MSEFTMPEMVSNTEQFPQWLLNAHETFESIGAAVSASNDAEKSSAKQIREEMLSTLEAVPEMVPAFEVFDSAMESIAAENPRQVLLIADRLDDLTTYFRKFANYVVDTEMSIRNREATLTQDSSDLKELQTEIRDQINGMLMVVRAMPGIDVPDEIPVKEDGSYAGELQRGGGAGGRKAKASVLTFYRDGEPIETHSPRKVEEVLFRHINPESVQRFNSVGELEEHLGHSVFETPWQFAGVECRKVETN